MTIDPVQEKHYNVRAAVPDHLDVFARWRRWSEAYRAERPDARLDLAYGAGAREVLDFFPARRGGGDAPLVLLIHGGYWQAMDKRDNRFAARALCDAGCAVAVVNYTLCPAISLQGIVDQMRRASLWLWRNEGALPFDPQRMIVIGHSAGGHLAAMMLCTDWPAVDPRAPQEPFKGGIAVSGLFDLAPLVETTINDKVGLTPADAAALSPVHQVPRASAAFVVAVGGAESAGFHDQAHRLRDAWARHGVEVTYRNLPGRHHFQAFEALAEADSDLFKAAEAVVRGGG